MINSETEMCVDISIFYKNYLEVASFEDGKCNTLRVRSSGSALRMEVQHTNSEVIRQCFKNGSATH